MKTFIMVKIIPPLFILRTANMSSAQKSEEIEEDYDPVSKNSKIFQVENLVDFFYRTQWGSSEAIRQFYIDFCFRFINIFLCGKNL